MSYFRSGPRSLGHDHARVATRNTLVARWVERMGGWESPPGQAHRSLWHPGPFRDPRCTFALPYTPTVVHTNCGNPLCHPLGFTCSDTDCVLAIPTVPATTS